MLVSLAFHEKHTSSRSLTPYAALWFHLERFDMGLHFATAVPSTHPSVPASAPESRASPKQTPSASEHVGNIHPDTTGSMRAFQSNFDSWPASEFTWGYVTLVCSEVGGAQILCNVIDLDKRKGCLERGITGHSIHHCRQPLTNWSTLLNLEASNCTDAEDIQVEWHARLCTWHNKSRKYGLLQSWTFC